MKSRAVVKSGTGDTGWETILLRSSERAIFDPRLDVRTHPVDVEQCATRTKSQ